MRCCYNECADWRCYNYDRATGGSTQEATAQQQQSTDHASYHGYCSNEIDRNKLADDSKPKKLPRTTTSFAQTLAQQYDYISRRKEEQLIEAFANFTDVSNYPNRNKKNSTIYRSYVLCGSSRCPVLSFACFPMVLSSLRARPIVRSIVRIARLILLIAPLLPSFRVLVCASSCRSIVRSRRLSRCSVLSYQATCPVIPSFCIARLIPSFDHPFFVLRSSSRCSVRVARLIPSSRPFFVPNEGCNPRVGR